MKCFVLFFKCFIITGCLSGQPKLFSNIDKDIKFNGILICPTNTKLLKDNLHIGLEFKCRVGDSIFYKLRYDEVSGLDGQAILETTGYDYVLMKIINEEVYLEYEHDVYEKFSMARKFKFFEFNGNLNVIWHGAGNIFYHNYIQVKQIEKKYNTLLKDTVYRFSITGDYSTGHHVYLSEFSLSKLYGFIRLRYRLDGGCSCIYISEYLMSRKRLRKYISAGQVQEI